MKSGMYPMALAIITNYATHRMCHSPSGNMI
jgi:hypothetical protein